MFFFFHFICLHGMRLKKSFNTPALYRYIYKEVYILIYTWGSAVTRKWSLMWRYDGVWHNSELLFLSECLSMSSWFLLYHTNWHIKSFYPFTVTFNVIAHTWDELLPVFTWFRKSENLKLQLDLWLALESPFINV